MSFIEIPIEVIIDEKEIIDISIEETTGSGGGELPYYPGPYEVTPKINQQVLPTAYKSMSKDVQVLEIPYSEVHNISGTTVTIGGE